MKELSRVDLFNLMDLDVWPEIEKSLEKYPDYAGIVVFENQTLDSSACGARTACVIGPSNTYGTPDECKGKWLNDLPSQRQQAAYYWLLWRAVPEERIRHIWRCGESGCENFEICEPDNYADEGTAFCKDCETLMHFARTEIRED